LRQIAGKVDQALRGVLTGLELPLILAATVARAATYGAADMAFGRGSHQPTAGPPTSLGAELVGDEVHVLGEEVRDRRGDW
jgi:release factor family 11